MNLAGSLPRVIQALRIIISWKNPEIMCFLNVSIIVLGLPVALVIKYYTTEDVPPQQHGTGRILDVRPGPNEMVSLPTVIVTVEMCCRRFSQGTVVGAHMHLKAGMFVPVVFLVRHPHGEPSEMDADFSQARDISLNQSEMAICSQLKDPRS